MVVWVGGEGNARDGIECDDFGRELFLEGEFEAVAGATDQGPSR